MTSMIVTYLLDPLCGWCYGAAPVLEQLAQQTNVTVKLSPTGLFAGENGRTMNAAFADYAWSNDVRIEKLTGQRFTEVYRSHVLGRLGKRFDSALATLALTAVSLTDPLRELDALTQLQKTRYVDGRDITDIAIVTACLDEIGLDRASVLLSREDTELNLVNQERLRQSRLLLTTYGIAGVPNLVVTDQRGSRLVDGSVLFGSLKDALSSLEQ
ncbi:DsbA family protein [Undibacterium sp. RuRC25W]|uniref:DsbA family protein n=1 Tax=Undibacterium sp. RuRC25W TaxID=3413047 RepID=UPI003BF12AD4